MKSKAEDDRFVKIVILSNEIEAQLLDSILKEHNIPHVMRTYHHLVYDGIFQSHKGWGQVDAPKRFGKEILKIYSDLSHRE